MQKPTMYLNSMKYSSLLLHRSYYVDRVVSTNWLPDSCDDIDDAELLDGHLVSDHHHWVRGTEDAIV